MIGEAISNVIYGKHSNEMVEFEAHLNRGDTQACLDFLDKNSSFANRVERDIYGHDTPLNMAIRSGNAIVCDKLLAQGARMDVAHKWEGEEISPMAMMFKDRFTRRPEAKEILAVFVKHYDERREAEKSRPNLFDGLKAKAAGIFNTFVERVDALVKSPAVGIAGMGGVGSAVGSALGLVAAGSATLPAIAPVMIGGVGIGAGMSLVHLVRKQLDPDKERQDYLQQLASERFEQLADERQAVLLKANHEKHGQAVNSKASTDIDVSLREAKTMTTKDHKEIVEPDLKRGRYTGKVTNVTPLHVVQEVGKGRAVLHLKSALDQPVSMRDQISVKYHDGKANVQVRGQSQNRGHSR